MKLSEIEIGKIYTYYPPKEHMDDNRHYPAKVLSIAKLVRVRVFFMGAENGKMRSVSAKRLAAQGELLE